MSLYKIGLIKDTNIGRYQYSGPNKVSFKLSSGAIKAA